MKVKAKVANSLATGTGLHTFLLKPAIIAEFKIVGKFNLFIPFHAPTLSQLFLKSRINSSSVTSICIRNLYALLGNLLVPCLHATAKKNRSGVKALGSQFGKAVLRV